MKALSIAAVCMVLYFSLMNCSTQTANPLTNKSKGVTTGEDNYFLFLSDVHLVSDEKATQYGEDTGTDLWDSVQKEITTILQSDHPPKFILYTGDLPQHNVSSDTALFNTDIRSVFRDLQKFSAVRGTPVFYIPGNNDALAGDYCFFSDAQGRTPFSLLDQYSPYPYKAYHVASSPLVSGAYMISDTNLSDGYYSAQIMDNLRVISLNSVIWSATVCNSCQDNCNDQQSEGRQQMNWLTKQLKAASDAGDHVYIAMHIPPGLDAHQTHVKGYPVAMWTKDKGKQGQPNWQNEFLSLSYLYKNTIAGIFYGHTHMDEFRVLYGNPSQDTITQVAISCPGISVKNGNNPGFKKVYFDPKTKLPIDFTTIYANNVNPIEWAKKNYQFTEFIKVKQGSSIYESLRDATDAKRKQVLESIYDVKRGNVQDYDTLGLNVRIK